jgi:hypothetical protein
MRDPEGFEQGRGSGGRASSFRPEIHLFAGEVGETADLGAG